MAERYVALMRGINVGGKNLLAMKDLAAIFVAAGCSGVQTYIQSGNVVFEASSRLAKRIPSLIPAEIAQRFGLTVPVMVRTAGEMSAVIAGNPFLKKGGSEELLHVLFLADAPDPKAELDPLRSPPDEFVLSGREVYLRCPNGAGKTKLTNAYFDSKLRTISTGRNWRTVLKLREMMGGG